MDYLGTKPNDESIATQEDLGGGGGGGTATVISNSATFESSAYTLQDFISGRFKQDNFFVSLTTTGNVSEFRWFYNNANGTIQFLQNAVRGSVLQRNTNVAGDGFNSDMRLGTFTSTNGTQSWQQFKFISIGFTFLTNPNNFNWYFGLNSYVDFNSSFNGDHGVSIEKSVADVEFYLVTRSGGVSTRTPTGITPVIGTWYDFRLRAESDGSVSLCTVNLNTGIETVVVNNTTNVPTYLAMILSITMTTAVAAVSSYQLDYVNYLVKTTL